MGRVRSCFIVGFILWLPIDVFAGSVSAASVWFSRELDDSSGSESYGFACDIWGTVDEFATINLISPLDNSYSLDLSDEGDQWGCGFTDTQAQMESEFVDGIYRFDVTYKDNSTESVQVQLGGNLPPYPENISLTGNRISWDSWQSPESPQHVAVAIYEDGGPVVASDQLPADATSFQVPSSLSPDKTYKVFVAFVTSEFTDGFKNSRTVVTTSLTPSGKPANTGNGNGNGNGNGSTSILLIFFTVLLLTKKSRQRYDRRV